MRTHLLRRLDGNINEEERQLIQQKLIEYLAATMNDPTTLKIDQVVTLDVLELAGKVNDVFADIDTLNGIWSRPVIRLVSKTM